MLREMTIDDLEDVKTLARPWLEESEEDLNFSDRVFTETFLHHICNPEVHFYVVELDGAIVAIGGVSVRNVFFKEKTAHLEWFYVHKCVRGTGVGLKLAEFLRDLSLKKGARIITADTIFARYARVFRNMFEKLGFEQAGYTMIYRI